ncbi:hypothetical protein ACFOD0_13985 [Shewanella intestini]|uniref:DUF2946 domain-containing protein n=1 Tax=Shewanella intestini TaxID=2017544 RepID=A0ABS5I2S7_9GAMM|nr:MULTISPECIES: hypothetical protein [Shewanella]MBR9728304.1 hypothetical protein [Shewanella intestini]MRG35769.1 hypothetical protein [Shewanella sp. XMDDZSB0408]
MKKRMVYFTLLLSLLGQFILTPAMAMPKFLHSVAMGQMQMMHNMPMTTSMPHAIKGQHSTECHQHMKIAASQINCSALCANMGHINFIAHFPSVINIDIFALSSISSPQSDVIHLAGWTALTAEQSRLSRPPKHQLA